MIVLAALWWMASVTGYAAGLIRYLPRLITHR